jgi:receptor protein-tyrosine kinase
MDIRINFSELRRRGMITPDNLSSTISFEFRAIKRRLLAAARDANSKEITKNLIMITSALPGEGKTFTATNLALALAAERDLRVLLIDADAIKPTVGQLFEHSGSTGFTDLLTGTSAKVSDVMHRCADLPNLSVIFSGKRDERAPELISSRRTADLLAEISGRYDNRVVIFDTPPVLGSAEPANLAMYMHQVLVVVAAGAANRHQIHTTLENISACPNVSIVFNKAPKWHKADTDTYYYYRSEGAPAASSNN